MLWYDALFSSPSHKSHSLKELLIPPLLSDGILTLQKLKQGKACSDPSTVPLSSRYLNITVIFLIIGPPGT